ncbi:nucleoside-diphosphate kinase [Coprothermobacteraceae bacterium]|nr:nucleoside-diphosphate kinase [Coprothermobacteraceae bacterium]
MAEKTLVIYKPDAIQRNIVGEITIRFQDRGLKLVAAKMGWYPVEFWEEFYAEHKGKEFYVRLVNYMSSGPVFVTVWAGENSIAIARQLAGATDPMEAVPGTIRGNYGLGLPMNTVHCCDSEEAAEREIPMFFKDEEIFEW